MDRLHGHHHPYQKILALAPLPSFSPRCGGYSDGDHRAFLGAARVCCAGSCAIARANPYSRARRHQRPLGCTTRPHHRGPKVDGGLERILDRQRGHLVRIVCPRGRLAHRAGQLNRGRPGREGSAPHLSWPTVGLRVQCGAPTGGIALPQECARDHHLGAHARRVQPIRGRANTGGSNRVSQRSDPSFAARSLCRCWSSNGGCLPDRPHPRVGHRLHARPAPRRPLSCAL